MKKKLLILTSVILIIFVFICVFLGLRKASNRDIVTKLKGQIYYTKRVNDILTLYKSNANLENEKLIYSHKGKGKDSYGGYNDNVIDYYYDIESDKTSFIAMNNGDWSLLSIEKGEIKVDSALSKEKTSCTLDNNGQINDMEKTNYISNTNGNVTAIAKKGSIYIIESGKEKCVKKFYGLYTGDFTGYSPVGFSPDGKYLIYNSMGHMSFLGTIIEGMLTGSSGHKWIMDLNTEKSTRFIDSDKIQWITN